MRVGRLELPEGARWGVFDGDRFHVLDGPPWTAGDAQRHRLATVSPRGCRYLAPVTPSKIVAVGRNYRHHVQEMGYLPPSEPNLFLKPPSAITGPDTAVVLPPPTLSTEVEHEAELAVVIGREARNLRAEDALDHVFGFSCANDVSARDLQRRDASITRAKGFDTFCPIGPWIETDIDLDRGCAVRCEVNGERRQDGQTDDMIFDVPAVLSYVTQVMTLLPGDVVLTGSPGGSGPLRAGDRVTIEIEDVGALRHTVIADHRVVDTGTAVDEARHAAPGIATTEEGLEP
jgi:2-keto-4-pentenoate hydratase/2-oxohepta-3-ene-1,7-dioic acid hydratase in catechol pathway